MPNGGSQPLTDLESLGWWMAFAAVVLLVVLWIVYAMLLLIVARWRR